MQKIIPWRPLMPPRNVKGWKHLLVSQCNMTGAIGYSSVTSRGRHTLLQRERHTHGGTYFSREAGNSLFWGGGGSVFNTLSPPPMLEDASLSPSINLQKQTRNRQTCCEDLVQPLPTFIIYFAEKRIYFSRNMRVLENMNLVRQILKGAIPFVSQPCSLRQSKNIFTPILLQNLISEEEV